MQADDSLAVNDPIYPFQVPVPRELVSSVRAMISQLAVRPVLSRAALPRQSNGAEADTLAWMEKSGLVLRTELGSLDPACARGALGQPVFVIREVDGRADILSIA
jgi:hypothetical protein